RARDVDHRGVEFDLHDLGNAGRAQQFASRQTIAATQDQHGVGAVAERGVHETFGVAVFVAGGELQAAVEVQPGVGAAAGDHDLLIRRVPVGDDRVGVKPLPACGFD